MNEQKKDIRLRKYAYFLMVILLILFAFSVILKRTVDSKYSELQSVLITDRNDEIIAIKPNIKESYSQYIDVVPERFENLLIKKEDRFFYFHLGINPISTLRAILTYIKTDVPGGSSTITQQLAKNLLGNEQDRTIENKIVELFYAFAIEITHSKNEILKMYTNTVYMGNQIQGFETAANAYFGKTLSELDDTEIVSLLATVSSPSNANPWKYENARIMKSLSNRIGVVINPSSLKTLKKFQAVSSANFELADLPQCKSSCQITIDKNLTDNLREILDNNLAMTSKYGGRNGAIVVIKLPENELLSIIGTSNTKGSLSGSSINMAVKPRPIGSTIKPFIYLKAFEMGLRPYSLVDDKEYKYSIGTGFPLYPKNYDGSYRGIITLRESLSNSLNTPSVKTLEFISLPKFYSFLENELSFKPISPLDSYQFGIALGGLEMDPLTLAHLFTIFGNKGELKPLKMFMNTSSQNIMTPQRNVTTGSIITNDKYVQLVNSIISDRLSGVDQFGLASNLNLTQKNYAVKTGTSRDYHDTWTVGFTPDFLVVVWLGNAENEEMRQITSSTGAGKIWNESMELLMNSDYNKKTPLDFSQISHFKIDGKIESGIADDDVKLIRNLLLEEDLIDLPHDGDKFLLEENTQILFKSRVSPQWYVDGKKIGSGSSVTFRPNKSGSYNVTAKFDGKSETISFIVTQ